MTGIGLLLLARLIQVKNAASVQMHYLGCLSPTLSPAMTEVKNIVLPG